MRFLTVKVAAALIALMCAASGSAQDTGRAMLASPDQAAWNAVGRLTVQAQGFCTATAIAPDIVLTAAHCVVDKRKGGTVDAARVHFVAGMRADTHLASAGATEVLITPGFDMRARDIASDIALVILDRALPDTVRPIALDFGARADRPFTLVSYGIDRSRILSVESGCRLDQEIGGVLVTDCEGVPGVSGAPLLQETDGVFSIAGVASAVVRKRSKGVVRGPVLASATSRPWLHTRAQEGRRLALADIKVRPVARDGS